LEQSKAGLWHIGTSKKEECRNWGAFVTQQERSRMKEFVLIFRMDITTEEIQPSPAQMKLYMAQWMEWINNISAQERLANGGNHLSRSGKVLRPKDVMTDGPYTVNGESVAGYIIILANDIDHAVRIAKKCPILQGEGTSVEVRETATPEIMRTTKRVTNC
jgi:hypothetical protein